MISHCMKQDVITVAPTDTVARAATVIAERRVGTLPVVTNEGRLIGIVRLQDILKIFMPDFVALLDNIEFVSDFGALEHFRPSDLPAAATMTMDALMSPPISVKSSCGLLRSFAIMTRHQLQDLPVVDEEGRLVGIASRVDIAAAFFRDFIKRGHLA